MRDDMEGGGSFNEWRKFVKYIYIIHIIYFLKLVCERIILCNGNNFPGICSLTKKQHKNNFLSSFTSGFKASVINNSS